MNWNYRHTRYLQQRYSDNLEDSISSASWVRQFLFLMYTPLLHLVDRRDWNFCCIFDWSVSVVLCPVFWGLTLCFASSAGEDIQVFPCLCIFKTSTFSVKLKYTIICYLCWFYSLLNINCLQICSLTCINSFTMCYTKS